MLTESNPGPKDKNAKSTNIGARERMISNITFPETFPTITPNPCINR